MACHQDNKVERKSKKSLMKQEKKIIYGWSKLIKIKEGSSFKTTLLLHYCYTKRYKW